MSMMTGCVCKYRSVVPCERDFAVCDGRCQDDPEAREQIERWATEGRVWREKRNAALAALDTEPRDG